VHKADTKHKVIQSIDLIIFLCYIFLLYNKAKKE